MSINVARLNWNHLHFYNYNEILPLLKNYRCVFDPNHLSHCHYWILRYRTWDIHNSGQTFTQGENNNIDKNGTWMKNPFLQLLSQCFLCHTKEMIKKQTFFVCVLGGQVLVFDCDMYAVFVLGKLSWDFFSLNTAAYGVHWLVFRGVYAF